MTRVPEKDDGKIESSPSKNGRVVSNVAPAAVNDDEVVSCSCENHLDKVEADMKLSMTAAALYELLFGGSMDFMKNIHLKRGDFGKPS